MAQIMIYRCGLLRRVRAAVESDFFFSTPCVLLGVIRQNDGDSERLRKSVVSFRLYKCDRS